MRSYSIKLSIAMPLFFLVCASPIRSMATDSIEASAKMDPCSLVSLAEARSVLSVEIGAPVSNDDGFMRHCTYSNADKRKSLMLEAQTTDRTVFERWMKLHGTPAPEVGSDAYTNAGVLLVWKNGTQVNVKISDQSGKTSSDQLEAAQEKVALLVLQRL